ncbi:MAG: hypothetical protein JSR72_14645 [Proteobacteria bacterium]|nr:hypothetical protein [Pseudomonadota bacterium]
MPSSLGGPERLVPVSTEMALIRNELYPEQADGSESGSRRRAMNPSATAAVNAAERNRFITARKYAIDVQYSEYEGSIIREAELTDFGAKVATIALTQTASLIPVAHTARLLTQISTGVDSVDSAYNEKILRAQLIQNILASMRIARYNQAAVIYANMYCDESVYTLPMALSDLEVYYRAGTVPTGIVKLTQTVAKAETIAQATENGQKPSGAEGKAVLDGAKAEAETKAQQAATPSCKSGPVRGVDALLSQIRTQLPKIRKQPDAAPPAPAQPAPAKK